MDLYYRNLPHWQPADNIFFITFRLAQSLPRRILEELRNQRELEEKAINAQLGGIQRSKELHRLNKKYFGKFDAWLDRCTEKSPRWLANTEVARLVMQEILRLDAVRYKLIACCIMPNHVHLLVDTTGFQQITTTNKMGPSRAYPLTETLRVLKGRTARFGNQRLCRNGAFWQHESYDHVVRDEHELERIIEYMRENPVKANLSHDANSYPYTVVRD
jgi:putative transposase